MEIEPELERKAKKNMNAFTAIKKIQLGDVIRVSTWVPHSLQHGVRVVEFQTPTYERFIISFEQKVLTQKNWDSKYAINRMHLDPPIELGPTNQSLGVERLANFSSFSAIKVDFSQVNHFNLSNTTNYAICLLIGTTCKVGDLTVPPEKACLIPNESGSMRSTRGSRRVRSDSESKHSRCCLKAFTYSLSLNLDNLAINPY